MKQNKPVIGILPTFNLTNEKNDPHADRASFVRLYIEKISACGGIPLGLLEENIEDYLELCDGFLWPGGTKIWPTFYRVLDHALETHKPVLGVCMGTQAIATYFNVIEDQKKYPGKTFDEVYDIMKESNPYLVKMNESERLNHTHTITYDSTSISNAKHLINIKENTLLYKLFGCSKLNVVSIHSMKINRSSKSLKINALSNDSVIEGLEYLENKNNILGVQFHPEIGSDVTLFKWLIDRSKEVQNARNSWSRNSKTYFKRKNTK